MVPRGFICHDCKQADHRCVDWTARKQCTGPIMLVYGMRSVQISLSFLGVPSISHGPASSCYLLDPIGRKLRRIRRRWDSSVSIEYATHAEYVVQ